MTEPPFKNRRGGLIFFGIVLILFGLMAGGMAMLMITTLFLPKAAGQQVLPVGMLAGSVAMYLTAAAVFFILGVGSMMPRRWARALIYAISWMWLITGVLTSVGLVAMSGSMFATLPEAQATARPFIIGCMAVICLLFGITVPLALMLFYRGPNVRATVESLDPVPRWTDRVPAPVLVFAIWMLFGAVSTLMCTGFYTSFPVGTVMLRGITVTALFLIFSAVMFAIAIGSIRLEPAAWWAALVFLILGAVYAAVVVPRTDLIGWMEQINPASDPRQFELLRSMYSGPFFYIWMGVIWAGYLAFLLYIRRFFVGFHHRDTEIHGEHGV